MPRIFVGNFDFEHDLTSGPRELSREARSLAADLVSVWLAVAKPDDVIWSPTGVPSFDFADWQRRGIALPRFVSSEPDLPRGADWELVPWGWTSQLLAWGRKQGWSCPAPPIDIVRQVNSRIFRWELEVELGVALPGSVVIKSVQQLLAHVAQHAADGAGWVLKANFGMAGRERSLGRGPKVEEHVLNWARKRLATSDGLVFEPWLDRMSEAGFQWRIPAAGEPQLVGITRLLTDTAGGYRGSRIATRFQEYDDWQRVIEPTRTVAQRLQSLGYWGPLGVDVMRYRVARDQFAYRPLQDVNARWTMGRIALGLQRLLLPEYTANWLHDHDLVTEALSTDPRASVFQTTARSWLVMQPGEATWML